MVQHRNSAWCHSPTGQQRSSSPRCSSPARSAIEPALPSAPCSVLSSPRPPQPHRRRWWHSARWCSSPQSAPSGPVEESEDGGVLLSAVSLFDMKRQRAELTTRTLPRKPGPVRSLSGVCCRSDWRYIHIPVKKSLGWPISIQKPSGRQTSRQYTEIDTVRAVSYDGSMDTKPGIPCDLQQVRYWKTRSHDICICWSFDITANLLSFHIVFCSQLILLQCNTMTSLSLSEKN